MISTDSLQKLGLVTIGASAVGFAWLMYESSKLKGETLQKGSSRSILHEEHEQFERDIKFYHENLTEEMKESLAETAQKIASPGKGILAADESTGTIGKRLVKAGLENIPEARRAYREVLFAHPDLGNYLGGSILFEETLLQTNSEGVLFPQVLASKGVLPGVKTDKGLDPLNDSPRETQTKGMDTLLERSRKYVKQGAKFAKWRAVIRISEAEGLPTNEAMKINAIQLARYAMISQIAGLVPIVEPEILIEGTHSADKFAEISENMIGKVYHCLSEANVFLEGTLLKPQMILAGVDNPKKPTSQELAEKTLQVLRRRVPPAVPGIMFLSGGQTEEEATINLNLINTLAKAEPTKHPWHLSFSFGRSLQGSVLELHAQGPDKKDQAIEMACALAKVNSQAQLGTYVGGNHPSLLGNKSLHETNRGWRQGEEKAPKS